MKEQVYFFGGNVLQKKKSLVIYITLSLVRDKHKFSER